MGWGLWDVGCGMGEWKGSRRPSWCWCWFCVSGGSERAGINERRSRGRSKVREVQESTRSKREDDDDEAKQSKAKPTYQNPLFLGCYERLGLGIMFDE